MEFISVRDFRIRPGEIWEKLKDQDLVVTSNGRPIAILSPVEGENIEETFALLRRLRAQMAVSRMRKEAAEAGLDRLSEEEIEAEIRKARDEARG
jgi:antitoxin (DNA-binding transcriptional repressor) of toxin-antitoxin stability system